MTPQEFDDAIQRVTSSGALGRSATYAKLLRYLGDCSANGQAPKEIDIAVEVFDRTEGFDPSQDSMVRVYVHNLRQKLESYYEQHDDPRLPRLEIPKGQYRLVLRPAEEDALVGRQDRRANMFVAVAILGVAFGWWLATTLDGESPAQGFASAPIWSAVLNDDLPVTLVTGDYFMFAELDDSGMPARLVRDFEVNSSADLRRLQRSRRDATTEYGDLDLTYLPVGSAPAVASLMQVLSAHGKQVTVVPASRLQIESLRDTHVVYVGYLSGLGQLAQFVFSAAGIGVGYSYDELFVIDTGERFMSEAVLATDDEMQYVDYGYVSVFNGPEEGAVIVVAGTRDEGLMQSARYLTSPEGISDLQSASTSLGRSEDAGFEVLLEVSGIGRTHLGAKRVYTGPTTSEDVWTVR